MKSRTVVRVLLMFPLLWSDASLGQSIRDFEQGVSRLVGKAHRANGDVTGGFFTGGVLTYPTPPDPANLRYFTLEATTSPLTDGEQGLATLTAVPVVNKGSAAPISQDRTVRALVNVVPGNSSDVGLALRVASTPDGRTNGIPASMRFGYAFALDFTDGELEVFEASLGIRTQLASGAFTSGTFDPSLSYLLEFTALGTRLTGKVFDPALGPLSTPLGELTTFDDTRTQGQEALFAGFQDDPPLTGPDARPPLMGAWDNFELLPPIPEPGAAPLLLASGSLPAFRRRWLR